MDVVSDARRGPGPAVAAAQDHDHRLASQHLGRPQPGPTDPWATHYSPGRWPTKPATSSLIAALAAIHAARPKMIRTMQLGDVDLGNRRITVGGRARQVDDLTLGAVLNRLDHRRNRWPNTANPH
ncbi:MULTISPECIES: hypothetical protein [unclassified Streptomyces]|uniref:hypothetical protein n=1 Tax=unclassified Streptomyces TaxID=2593676 RepID=UPI000DD955D6|nr:MULTISPECIES: hypothetical protein [unclassified Streptomyces]QZZ25514.1 hypothetical protein A7X85_03760 [Streptomyces sp. ST1015]